MASLFRNFLLAERIMSAAGCTPISYPRYVHIWERDPHLLPYPPRIILQPVLTLLTFVHTCRLPPTHSHPMWQAWDMAAEMCLMQLPTLLSDPGADFQPSPFFSEQLTAFELWLQHGSRDKKPPEQLPIVLQVRSCPFHPYISKLLTPPLSLPPPLTPGSPQPGPLHKGPLF